MLAMIQAAEPSGLRAMLDQVVEVIGRYLPNLLGAVAVLVLGSLAAWLLSGLVRSALRRTTLDNRLVAWVVGDEKAKTFDVERRTGQVVFYLLLVFVLVAFFQALGLTLLTEPLTAFLNRLWEYAPRLFGAGLLLLVAWIVAFLLKKVTFRVLSVAKWQRSLAAKAGFEEKESAGVAKTISEAVYWIVLVLFLPGVLGALSAEGLLEPLRGMTNQVVGFLPQLFAAALILFGGWLVARVLRRVVASLAAAVGADRLGERAGLGKTLGTQRLSGLLGFLVYVLVLIPVLVAALNALELEAVTQPARDMLGKILDVVPAILSAALILGIAFVVGRLLAGWITTLLAGAGFDSLLHRIGLGREPKAGRTTLSQVAGTLVLAAVLLLASMEAARGLGLEELAVLTSDFLAFAGRVLLGLVIFGFGLFLGNLAAKAVSAGRAPESRFLAGAARLSIATLAAVLALGEMGVGGGTIQLAFAILLGAIAVAAAIAFGVGGREIAAAQLRAWVDSWKAKKA